MHPWGRARRHRRPAARLAQQILQRAIERGQARSSAAGLEALPATGFRISCFPHKIHAASAGWTRAVAIIDDTPSNNEENA